MQLVLFAHRLTSKLRGVALTVASEPGNIYRRALVVGTVRNASKFVTADISRIIQALEPIIPALAFIVESDSEDDTVEKLKTLCAVDSRVQFVSLGSLEHLFSERLARLKHCRNVYLDQIKNNPIYSDCDLIVVADLDGINTAISQRNAPCLRNKDQMGCFGRQPEWPLL